MTKRALVDDGPLFKRFEYQFSSGKHGRYERLLAGDLDTTLLRVLLRVGSEANGIQYDRFWDAGEPKPSPAIVADATEVMQMCDAVRHYREIGHLDAVGFFAFKLGAAYQRMLARDAEPIVLDGQVVRQARSQGGRARGAKYAKKRRLYQEEVNRQVRNGLTYSSAVENVSRHFKVSKRHVQEHTQNPRKC